jgi:hypothetical protein
MNSKQTKEDAEPDQTDGRLRIREKESWGRVVGRVEGSGSAFAQGLIRGLLEFCVRVRVN